MIGSETLVLSGGGFKSQVAAAALGAAARPAMLFVHDGRPGEARSRAAFDAICDHLQARRRDHVAMANLFSGHNAPGDFERHAPSDGTVAITPLAGLQLLCAAAAHALRVNAQRLVWAVRAGDDFDKLSQITEAVVMVEHLAAQNPAPAPVPAGAQADVAAGVGLRVETPLLEMTGPEIIEVGQQLGVPWNLSRDCWLDGEAPCGACPGCRERHDAFAAAALQPEPPRP